ncbi:hypothetical protein F3J24_20230 [Comamonas sp. Tr-654]|uniref:hypothetical protein n=1 Tax=Comamonas sp. Tr-654 TaxID=2608341 RepID=UPI00142001DA|nr:hypothetical protein [Comamonas sp. Tr-654]NIF85810.1 hypothetical protein [Comamonas sp. Tr-654]
MKKLFALALIAAAVTGCASNAPSASIKDSYSVYLAPTNSSFGAPNGTLNRGGVFNVMFNGERFTGQNANNEILAKGNKGSTMTCRYTMPDAMASGSCAMSGGSTLNMKFD